MKILRLTVAGFGPYRDSQRIDFERFEGDGIFLITGPTGSGKSSILDAICYALFNSVPRYEGTQQQLRSQYAADGDPSVVELDFRIGATEYRVRRTPEYERPKRRGTGTTTAPATAELSRRNGETWEGIAARAVDVARELDRLLGLNREQFLQVILLAQNRFQEFLQAGNDERQAVLRTLFRSGRFQEIEQRLAARAKALEGRIGSAWTEIRAKMTAAASLVPLETFPEDAGPDWLGELLARAGAAYEAEDRDASLARTALAEAERRSAEATVTRERQERRARATESLRALDGEAPAVEADRARLDDAARADAVWGYLAGYRTAAESLATAREAEAHARDERGRHGETTDDLEAEIESASRALGALEAAVGEELRLREAEAELEAAREGLAAVMTASAAVDAELAGLPELIRAQRDALDAARVRAARRTAAAETVTRLEGARAAAERASALEILLRRSQAMELEASDAQLAASLRLNRLIEQRLNGHAAELARALRDGDPCPVCGSVEHPAPASGDGDEVGESDLEAARNALADAQTGLVRAHDTVAGHSTGLAAARGAAGERDLAGIESELRTARQGLADAESAEEELRASGQRILALEEALSSAQARREDSRAEAAAASERVAALAAGRDERAARVAAERGDYESVAGRAEAVRERLRAASALREAAAHTEVCRVAVTAAGEELERQLAQHRFPDEASVEAARRDAATVHSLTVRIREHDDAAAAARSSLAEPELAALPEELVQTDAARTEVETAKETADAAGERRANRAAVLGELQRLDDAVRTAVAGTEALREESERLRILTATVEGNTPNTKRMRLETYVLAAQLEEIVAAANRRLSTMTAGRFTLEHDDGLQFRNARSGLGLRILDQHTGRSRGTRSLSGGETFLASLALALGLAEVVTNGAGGITLDTLFIDEGFGSLDADTLEITMSTLDSLRAGGRTIGLISHVEAMKEQIPAKLRVQITARGDSVIEESYEPV